MIRAIMIWFVGVFTTPIVAGLIAEVVPMLRSYGWSDDQLNLTFNALRFLYPLMFLVMGLLVLRKGSRFKENEGERDDESER